MSEPKKVILFGAGDLAIRLASALQHVSFPVSVELVSRREQVHCDAQLLNVCSSPFALPVTSVCLDMLDRSALKAYCLSCQADLMVNCASLLSPWFYLNASNPQGSALGTVGFAAQLCCQLPPVMQLASVLQEIKSDAVLVNGAFPDAINAILGKLGMAPLCGIGNGGMLYRVIQKCHPLADIRLTAHHAVVQKLLSGEGAAYEGYCHIELDYVVRPWSEVVPVGFALERSKSLNALTAVHAAEVIEALLNPDVILTTCLPGVSGLQGGYSCRIKDTNITPLETQHIDQTGVEHLMASCAALDGIDHIDEQGHVFYTPECMARLPETLAFLGEPLAPERAYSRFQQLHSVLGEVC